MLKKRMTVSSEKQPRGILLQFNIALSLSWGIYRRQIKGRMVKISRS